MTARILEYILYFCLHCFEYKLSNQKTNNLSYGHFVQELQSDLFLENLDRSWRINMHLHRPCLWRQRQSTLRKKLIKMLASRYLRIRSFWEVTKLRSYNRKGNYYTRDFYGETFKWKKECQNWFGITFSKAKAMASEHFLPASRFPRNHPSHGGVGKPLVNCIPTVSHWPYYYYFYQ